MLHYVALCEYAPSVEDLHGAAQNTPEKGNLADLLQVLSPHWFGLLPGFHRMALDDDCVRLTLCVGPILSHLRELRFLADEVLWQTRTARQETPFGVDQTPPSHAPLDPWHVKAVARLCRRGTTVRLTGSQAGPAQLWRDGGFVLEDAVNVAPPDPWGTLARQPPRPTIHGVFSPRWPLKRSRAVTGGFLRMDGETRAAPPRHCVVIGAGLAGASVAAALATVCCADAAVFATAENVQIHGGIGFTWEHPAHLYFRRARSSALLHGSPDSARELLLQRLGV